RRISRHQRINLTTRSCRLQLQKGCLIIWSIITKENRIIYYDDGWKNWANNLGIIESTAKVHHYHEGTLAPTLDSKVSGIWTMKIGLILLDTGQFLNSSILHTFHWL